MSSSNESFKTNIGMQKINKEILQELRITCVEGNLT